MNREPARLRCVGTGTDGRRPQGVPRAHTTEGLPPADAQAGCEDTQNSSICLLKRTTPRTHTHTKISHFFSRGKQGSSKAGKWQNPDPWQGRLAPNPLPHGHLRCVPTARPRGTPHGDWAPLSTPVAGHVETT